MLSVEAQSVLKIINDVWCSDDNLDILPPPAILPVARFWWPRWLLATEKAGGVSYGASW